MRHVIIVVLCAIVFSPALSAQEGRLDYTAAGAPSSPGNSAYFVIGKKNKQGNFYDSVFSYYSRSGKLMSAEVRDGQGLPTGNFKNYYENGQLKMTGRYEHKNFKVYQSSPDSIEQVVVAFYDSTGRMQVRNGDGVIDARIQFRRERGAIVNGVRDGIWQSWYPNRKLYYQESWHDGELVDGVSYDGKKEIYYKTMRVEAEPNEGLSRFYERISQLIKYPVEAEKRGIEGKVILGFDVLEDGTIVDPKIEKGLGFGCNEEALRVLRLSPSWKPALLRGQPVRSKARITYVFKLT